MLFLRYVPILIFIFFSLISCSSNDNSSGDSNNTPAASALTYPSSISVRESNRSLHISWRTVTAASSYELLLDTQQNLLLPSVRSNNFKEILNITNPQIDISDLQNGIAYYFVLRSVGANGEVSDYTEPTQATPIAIVPRAPTDFTATYANATSVVLQWTGDIDATTYKLFRAEGNSANYTALNESITSSPYTDDTIIAGRKYLYQLVASNDVGDSSAVTITFLPPPLTPSGFTANPLNDKAVNLSWTAGDSITDYYEISRSQDGGNSFSNIASSVVTTSYQDTGLTGGSQYVYQIVAVNSSGKSEALSGNYSSPIVPAVPLGFSATYVGPSSVKLTWTSDSAASNGYKLYRAIAGSTTFTPINEAIAAATNSYTDTSIAVATKYDYQLLASNIAGNSAAATLTYVPRPLPPTNFTATGIDGSSVDLAWTQGDTISDSFELSRSDNGAAFVPIGGSIANSGATSGVTTYQDSGLTPGQHYTYHVVAVNSGGKSNAVSVAYAAPQVPAAPAGFSATYVSPTSVTLTWTGDSAATNGYKLYRAASGSTTFTPIDEAIAAGTTSYSDNTVMASTIYDYQLLASNIAGNSTAATVSYIPPPLPASSFVATTVSDTQADLSWMQGDSITDSYELSRSDNGAAFVAIGGVIANSGAANGITSYQDTGLLGGHSYTYNVVSVNGGGKSAALGYDYVSPLKPIAPALNASLVSGPAVSLSWGAVDAATKKLVLSRAAAGTTNFTDIYTQTATPFTASYTDTTVVAGSNYDYRLLAYNGVVVSDPVVFNYVLVPSVPLAPSNLQAGDVTATSADLTWTDNSDNEDGFDVERSEQTGPTTWSAFTLIKSEPSNSVSSVDNSQTYTPGRHYKYHVVAKNVSGSSTSNEISTQSPPQDSHSFLAFANKSAPRFQETNITAQAYYDAIDPQHLKTTVADWKRLNGFGAGGPQDTPAVYINDADLGFARRMYVNSKVAGSQPGIYNVASYVENYATLQQAILGNPANIIATVAMEYTEPANPGVKPELLTVAPELNFDKTYVFNRILDPGNYIIRVAPDLNLGNTTTNYTFRVTDLDTSTTVINDVNRTWTVGRFQYSSFGDATSFATDFSGNEYTLNITTPLNASFELDSPVNATIYFARQYKIVGQATAASPGGSATISSLNLPVGYYQVVIGNSQIYAQPTLSNGEVLTVSYPTRTDSFTTQIFIGASSSPSNPSNRKLAFNVWSTDIPAGSTTAPVSLDLSMDANSLNSPLTPVFFIVDPSPSATGTPVTLYDFSYSNISNTTTRSSQIDTNFPDGQYSAVVTDLKFGRSFGLNFFDVNTQANFVCLGGAPAAVTLSQGPNPFIAGNPKCDFNLLGGNPNSNVNLIVSNTDVDALGNPLRTGDPLAKVIGAATDYRHIVAWAKPDRLPSDPRVIIRKTVAAGNYTLIPASMDIGNAANYQLTVTDLGSGASLLNAQSGWTTTPGMDINAAENPRHAFTVPAGGADVEIKLTIVNSSIVIGTSLNGWVLYLMNANGSVIDQSEDGKYFTGAFEADVLAGDYQISLAPNTTFELSYRSPATVRVYTDGVLTNTFSGLMSDKDIKNPFSPNALSFPVSLSNSAHVRVEFDSDYKANAYLIGKGDRKFVTFYTFIGQAGLDGLTQQGTVPPPAPFYPANLAAGDRVLAANLDTRGDKYQPGVCNVCHGGAPKSLVAGNYPEQGDTNAGFLAWDMDLFQYDTQVGSPYERATLEPTIREFNRTVLSVQRDATEFIPGQNSYQYVRNQLIYGWYGGVGLPNAFNGNYVPPGWFGQEQLYLQVIKPTCRLCHTQRDGIKGPTIAFATYSDFIGYKDDIERLVYDKGSMPLAKRTFDHFWSRGQADLLAQALNASGTPFNRYDAQNQVLQPGRPIAIGPYRADLPQKLLSNADIKRYMKTGIGINLDGSESLFATQFNWSVISAPAGATYTLNGATTANPTFTPSTDGDYTLQLIVGDGVNSSTPTSIVVNASSTYTPVSFSNNLLPTFDQVRRIYDYPDYPTHKNPFRECIGCHSLKEQDYNFGDYNTFNYYPEFNSNTFLWSVLGDPQQVYAALRDRANLSDPLESRILQTGDVTHHKLKNPFGWGWDDFSNDWQHYNLLLRWINEGAPNN